LFCIGIHN